MYIVGSGGGVQAGQVVARLPKTRSSKVLRRTMRSMADGQPYSVPATIDDPAIFDEMRESLSARRS